jgi:hypothetical protein
MAEGLQTPGGAPVDLDGAAQDFARAMAAPVTDVPAPPKMTDEQKADIEAKKAEPKRRGRPPKAERARIEAKATPEVLTPKDYSEALDGALTGVWVATAGLPFTTPYAAVIAANKAGLVGALNAGANQNAKVRMYVEKYTGGGGGLWQMQLAVVGAQMGMQTLQLMKDKELRDQAAASTRAQLQQWLTANGLVSAQAPEDAAPEGSPDEPA